METDPTLERQFKGHKDSVTSISFHPSTNQLSSSSLDHSIMLWNFQSSLRCYRFQGHRDAVLDTRFSPSGKLIASASRDCSVRLWVPTVRGECGEFRAHSKTVRSVDFSPTGTKLITASDDKTLKLWTVHRRKFLQSYVQHKNWVRCARFSPDGCMIASCSDDKTVKLWDAENTHCIHTFEELKGYGTHVAWHPSGSYFAVGLSNGTVKLYDVRKHCLLQHYRAHDGGITQLSFHPSGNFLIVASQDKKMKILDLLEGHPIYTLMGHNGAITAVTFSNDGEYFASGGADKQIMIWKTNFANAENFEDSKENISTLDTSVDLSEEKLNDVTKIVDARKSTFFRSDDNDEEECYDTGERSNPDKTFPHEFLSSTPNSPHQFKIPRRAASDRSKYYSTLFRRYYNEKLHKNQKPSWTLPEILFPVETQESDNFYYKWIDSTCSVSQADSSTDLTEEPAIKRQKIHNCNFESMNLYRCGDLSENSTMLATVNAMVCNLGSVQNILHILDQRLTILESTHYF